MSYRSKRESAAGAVWALVVVMSAVLIGGCANYLQPFQLKPAQPGLQSAAHSQLSELPPPKEKIVAAVYRFRDQTGQYKASDRLASWSTAVTQGATSILMRALETSGWFVPIEREGLSNLLNERQIIQSIRAQHTGPDGTPLGPLPPLLYAGLLLEGGVIGYDTNVLTGGVGLRYFGTGGAGQFRQDQVTIYLRAVSTQNGRVLKTVHTTKTIVSQKVDGGLFRYVDVARILEGETGYSFNEPPVLAVTEAIEEAVRNLVLEGVREGLWSLADSSDSTATAFARYDASVERASEMNYFGQVMRPRRSGLGLGVSAAALRYEGDYRDAEIRPGGAFYVRSSISSSWALGVSASLGELAAKDAFAQTHVAAAAQALYYLLPQRRVTPFLEAGAGVLVQDAGLGLGEGVFPYLTAGAGLEWMATPRLGMSVSLGNDYPLYEGLDRVKVGRIHDNLWALKTGLTFYPF